MPTPLERIGTRLANSRFGSALLAEERRAMGDALRVMERAYFVGPFDLPPEELVRQLREVSPYELQDVLALRGWDVLGGYSLDTDAQRRRAVQESIRLFRTNPLTQWSVWLWTSWGMGDKVTITVPDDKVANEIVAEFFSAPRNAHLFADDRIKELSRWLLTKGNRFFSLYISTQDGETRARLLDQNEMSFVSNPDDATDVWFYERKFTVTGMGSRTWYYPDWRLLFDDDDEKLEECWAALQKARLVPSDAKRADLLKGGTSVCILFAPHNIKDETSLWGWPLATVAWPWSNEHKTFIESRLTVAVAKAKFVRRKEITGGSRGLKSIRATIRSRVGVGRYDTNPPPAAGSVELDNQEVKTTDLPMRTGASDAKHDNDMFAWMTLLGYGLFPTTAGLDTARWATAVEMDKAQAMLFNEYQSYWATQLRKVARIVLNARDKYSNTDFADCTIEVNVDSLSLPDLPPMASALSNLTSQALTPLAEAGFLDAGGTAEVMATLWREVLDALGVEQAASLAAGLVPGSGATEVETSVIEQIAQTLAENAEAGVIDWQAVGEWALEELRE